MSETLAIDGGVPVRGKPFHKWPIYDEREEQALLRALHSDTWGMRGTETEQFEAEFAAAHGAKHAYTVTTGTAALEAALFAIDIKYGDEVIVPPYTFVATAMACLLRGAIPVFADIDPHTFNIDPKAVEAAITPRTRAIIPVHIGGCPASMDAILDIARRHNLRVIEDSCQAHAASWKGKPVGSMGDLAAFSFQSSKNIASGEGGAVLTNDSELAVRCESFRTYGRTIGKDWYQHDNLGTNFRMTQFQAAILRSQLTRMEEWAQRRQENGDYLAEGLRELGLTPQLKGEGVTRHAYHVFMVRYHSDKFGGWTRERFLEALNAEGIPANIGYFALPKSKGLIDGTKELRKLVYGEQGTGFGEYPVVDGLCREAFWIGQQSIFLGERGDMDDILEAVAKIRKAAISSP